MRGAFLNRGSSEGNNLYNAARDLQEVALKAESFGLFSTPYTEKSSTKKYGTSWEMSVETALIIFRGLRTYYDDILFNNLGIIGFENALKRVKNNDGVISLSDVKGLEISINELEEYNYVFVKERWPENERLVDRDLNLGSYKKTKKSMNDWFKEPEDLPSLDLHEPKDLAYYLKETVLVKFCCNDARLFPATWLSQTHQVGRE